MNSTPDSSPQRRGPLIAMAAGALIMGTAVSGCDTGEGIYCGTPEIIDKVTGEEITGDVRKKMKRIIEHGEEKEPVFSCGVDQIVSVPDDEIQKQCVSDQKVAGCYSRLTNNVYLKQSVVNDLEDPENQKVVAHEIGHAGQERGKESPYDLGFIEFEERFPDLPWHGDYEPQDGVEYNDLDQCVSFYGCKDLEEGHAEFVGYSMVFPYHFLTNPNLYAQGDLMEETFGGVNTVNAEVNTIEAMTTDYVRSTLDGEFTVFRDNDGELQIVKAYNGNDNDYYVDVVNPDGSEESFHLEDVERMRAYSGCATEKGFAYVDDSDDRILDLHEVDFDTGQIEDLGIFEVTSEYDWDAGKAGSFRVIDGGNAIYFLPAEYHGAGGMRIPYYDREEGDLKYLQTDVVPREEGTLSYSNIAGGFVVIDMGNRFYTVDLSTGQSEGGATGCSGANLGYLALSEGGDVYASGIVFTGDEELGTYYPIFHAESGDFQVGHVVPAEGDWTDLSEEFFKQTISIGDSVYFMRALERDSNGWPTSIETVEIRRD